MKMRVVESPETLCGFVLIAGWRIVSVILLFNSVDLLYRAVNECARGTVCQ